MKLKIFAVYDCKSQAYGLPMFLQQAGEATRSFQAEANNPESILCKNAEDFTLFEIGTWDPLTAEILPYAAKLSLGNALEYKKV